MRPIHFERYIKEVAQKTARIGRVAALLAILSILMFYLLDLYDLQLKNTIAWRGIGLMGALVFLIGRYFNKSANFVISIYAVMLSSFILMMNGIAFQIYTSVSSTPKQVFAVTVGCMTVWLVIAMIASGARKYMVYSGMVLMVGLALFLLADRAQSFGYIFSIYLTAFFAIIVMRNQEKQEREKATFVYQLEEREEKIARQRQELQNANENLVSFNYAITHDLKGPLRLAQSFTQLLERRLCSGELDEESKNEFFGHIKGSHAKIHQIIEDLLLLSRIGKNGLAPSSVQLEPMARSIWEEQTAGRKEDTPGLSFNSLGCIQADAKLLWHLLSNLISNAIKYSQHVADPNVEIGSYREEGGQTVLYVRDNGAGFDMQFAEELGKPFKRLHSTQQFEGTGIGLAIVRQVVNLHQGRFWAEGAEGQGATFYCAFPDKII
ncbi:MAG: GHKL domain-containing protein [Phaeodactylibacter sp.]|nr:GHKL domain-containing protein [Phaeodactylibacter sp.]